MLVCSVFDSGGVVVVLVFLGFGVLYWWFEVCVVIIGMSFVIICVYFVCVVLEVMVY